MTTTLPLQALRLSFILLLCGVAQLSAADPPDPARLKAAGIHVASGKHLTLYTDVDADRAALFVRLFDQAVPQWEKFFGAAADPKRPFIARGRWMASRPKFQAVGLWDSRLPNFRNGFCIETDFWLFDQPESEYYRRHLLLHEGVHAWMHHQLGGCGPTWCMEATAELLATHRLDEARDEIHVPYLPIDRERNPLWGRIDTIQTESAAGRGLSRADVWKLPPGSHQMQETYGWCWGMGAFLEFHPRYRDRFHRWLQQVREADFNAAGEALYASDQTLLDAEWKLFVRDCDYGYDFERCRLELPAAENVPPADQPVTIAADRSWQSSGLKVEAGKTYDFAASGRYSLGRTHQGKPQTWPCEPGGVTIRFRHGRPLGELHAALWTEGTSPAADGERPAEAALTTEAGLSEGFPIGLKARWKAPHSGVLYFRINEFPGEWSDDSGSLTVKVRPAAP